MIFNTLFFLFITDPAKVYCQSRIFHQREMGSGVQSQGLPRQNTGKESACQSKRCKFDPGVGKTPWRRRKIATHSGILAWEIPWTEEPGGLQYMGLSRVTHVHTHNGKGRDRYSHVFYGISLVVQWLRLQASNAGSPGQTPGQETRSHMLQLRVCTPQLKIPHAAMEIEDPTCHN